MNRPSAAAITTRLALLVGALLLGHDFVMAVAAPAAHADVFGSEHRALHAHEHHVPAGAADAHTGCGTFEAVRSNGTAHLDVEAISAEAPPLWPVVDTAMVTSADVIEPGAAPSQLRAWLQVYRN